MPSRLLARARLSGAIDSPKGESFKTFVLERNPPDTVSVSPLVPLDVSRVVALNAELVSALDGRIVNVLFDFSRVENVEPAGVGFLVALQKRMRNLGGELVLHSMRPKLLRSFETLGYGDFFTIALDARCALEFVRDAIGEVFPISTICPTCRTPLGIERPGRAKCRSCGALLTALPDGSVELG
jgi:anti-anti-sigma factor